MHPHAPEGSAPVVQLLQTSCLRRVIITFVVDGSFGWSEDEVRSAVKALRSNGQEVWLHLYVYNGPAQRRWASGLFHSFAIMDPLVFRRRMQTDPTLQREYRSIVRERVVPLLNFARDQGAKVSVAPGLEDNLDDAGFRQALKLLDSEIPHKLKPRYVRSVCYQCQIGNGRALPNNVLYEEHSDQYFRRVHHGIINTDGRYFRFKEEVNSLPLLSDWKPLLQSASQAGNAFILWVGHFQDAPPYERPKSPDQRNYRGPTQSESAQIIEFLRAP